jgi:hypothetical protein
MFHSFFTNFTTCMAPNKVIQYFGLGRGIFRRHETCGVCMWLVCVKFREEIIERIVFWDDS